MRSLNIKDINGNMIGDESSLTLDISNLKEESSNWSKLLIEAQKQGATKCFLKLKTLKPLFRIEYSIKFDVIVNSDDYNFFNESILNDVIFLNYIAPFFTLDSIPKNLEIIDWKKNHPLGLFFNNKEVMTNKEYIIEEIPVNFKKKFTPSKLKVKIYNNESFQLIVDIIPLKKDNTEYTNTEVEDLKLNSKSPPEDIKYGNKIFEYLIMPFSDTPFRALQDIFK